jgi:serine protease
LAARQLVSLAPHRIRRKFEARSPSHSDTLLTAEREGVVAYGGYDYKLDGSEDYIYPKTLPQPQGTVRLMRKYNSIRDDHAIFPEPQLVSMLYLGYTENSGSDWLGYVYQNTNGNVPVIQ